MADEQMPAFRREIGVGVGRLQNAGDALRVEAEHDGVMVNQTARAEHVDFEAGGRLRRIGERTIRQSCVPCQLERVHGAGIADDDRRVNDVLLIAPPVLHDHPAYAVPINE